MSSKVAPWLDGLNETWDVPANSEMSKPPPLASMIESLRGSKSRIPRLSTSGGLPPFRPDSSSCYSSERTSRNPLAPLHKNEANGSRRQSGLGQRSGSQSVSEVSESAGMALGTVQHRSKSASPGKKQETLEWRKRLMQGEVGYGDQTDLFGPSGLENIFSPSKEQEDTGPKVKNRLRWLQHSEPTSMPSSPPPWPSSYLEQCKQAKETALHHLVEETPQHSQSDEGQDDNSFRSNPFDLESSFGHAGMPPHDTTADLSHQSSRADAHVAGKQSHDSDVAHNRTVSGQTELEQEDFSPVFVSKHKTTDGKVGYTAVDSHLVKQYQSLAADPKISIGMDSQGGPTDRAHENNQYPADNNAKDVSIRADANLSFSENLPTGSPFPNLGHNVQFERGGYSRQGSFKQRPLSPSPSSAVQHDDTGASTLHSPLPPSTLPPFAPTPPPRPTTPAEVTEPKSKSSGSPLKLFAAHDTFTNNRLMRRLSQLNPDGTMRQPYESSKEEGSARSRRIYSGGSFGNGDLDDHAFDADITITSASDSDKVSSDRSPASDVPPPGSKTPHAFRFDISPPIKETFKMRRGSSKRGNATSDGPIIHPTKIREGKQHAANPNEVSSGNSVRVPTETHAKVYGDGKRPPTSPFKNPTPKRRRTLHASELEEGVQAMNDSYHNQLQDVITSRKRKDARRGEVQNMADPEILAQRKILRPRNPTPSQQRRQQQIKAELREAVEEFAEQEPEKLEAVMEHLESTIASIDASTLEQHAQTIASEVAAFTLRVQRPSGEVTERKRSVTTQDFFNEAFMVMNILRAKARPQSNLGSVEESDAEPLKQSPYADGSDEEESHLRVSRPPSREGSGWRSRDYLQPDARVVSHLRKFQDVGAVDDTDFIASSIAPAEVHEDRVRDQVQVVAEDAGVRITGPLSRSPKGKKQSDSRPSSQRSQGTTLDTHGSGGQSTGLTAGTASTRRSDKLGNLRPEEVVHAMGEQVAGLTFDRQQHRWIRVSKNPEKAHESFLEIPSNVTSDDDPFREISDLPVDEQKELRRLSFNGQKSPPPEPTTQRDGIAGKSTTYFDHSSVPGHSKETFESRPMTRENTHIPPNYSSSVPSKYTAFASSQQQEAKVETRATSWSDEELAKTQAHGPARKLAPVLSPLESIATGDEDDVSGFHGQQVFPAPQDATVTAEDSGVSECDEVEPFKMRQTPYKSMFQPSSLFRGGTREVSLRKQTLTGRFNAEVHEPSELSIIAPLPGDRIMSLSLSVSKPARSREQIRQVTQLPSSPLNGQSSFLLSDLPDFTVHENDDEQRPSEQALAVRLARHAAAKVDDRYAGAIKELVRMLTDVNEEEPYWQDLKHLDLHNRSLGSLYGLKDFCTGIRDMNASHNALQYLQGAPASIRRLDVSFNQLGSLTSWNHLPNLQYLDISNNRLENLDGLSSLVHLRELRADNNEITGIDGIHELDGLLELRLRNNKLRSLDFQSCGLVRLTQLDVSSNQIKSVHGMGRLCSLTGLDLSHNAIGDGINAVGPMPSLTSLAITDCQISCLEVSHFLSLSHLNVDDNRLSRIDGIERLCKLDVLSMRRQSIPEHMAITILESGPEASEIHLSGNRMSSLHLPQRLLNVRHLEIASAGLHELPADFGLCMPNLRTLNLSFNSLKDLRPLLNIHGLERLTACGNRIHRLRKSVAVLGKLHSLRHLDLRDNPLTQGFYPSLASTVSTKPDLVVKERRSSIGADNDDDVKLERQRYEWPAADVNEDERHRARLDEETSLKRRVYEVLLATNCHELSELDGQLFDGVRSAQRDFVWDRLCELEVVRPSQHAIGWNEGVKA